MYCGVLCSLCNVYGVCVSPYVNYYSVSELCMYYILKVLRIYIVREYGIIIAL